MAALVEYIKESSSRSDDEQIDREEYRSEEEFQERAYPYIQPFDGDVRIDACPGDGLQEEKAERLADGVVEYGRE